MRHLRRTLIAFNPCETLMQTQCGRLLSRQLLSEKVRNAAPQWNRLQPNVPSTQLQDCHTFRDWWQFYAKGQKPAAFTELQRRLIASREFIDQIKNQKAARFLQIYTNNEENHEAYDKMYGEFVNCFACPHPSPCPPKRLHRGSTRTNVRPKAIERGASVGQANTKNIIFDIQKDFYPQQCIEHEATAERDGLKAVYPRDPQKKSVTSYTNKGSSKKLYINPNTDLNQKLTKEINEKPYHKQDENNYWKQQLLNRNERINLETKEKQHLFKDQDVKQADKWSERLRSRLRETQENRPSQKKEHKLSEKWEKRLRLKLENSLSKKQQIELSEKRVEKLSEKRGNKLGKKQKNRLSPKQKNRVKEKEQEQEKKLSEKHEHKLSEKEEKISEKLESIVRHKQENTLSEENRLSDKQENRLREKQQKISEKLENNLSEKLEKISEKQNNIPSKDNRSSNEQENKLSEKQEKISEKQKKISEKQENILSEESRLSDKQENILSEENRLSDKQEKKLSEKQENKMDKKPEGKLNTEQEEEQTMSDIEKPPDDIPYNLNRDFQFEVLKQRLEKLRMHIGSSRSSKTTIGSYHLRQLKKLQSQARNSVPKFKWRRRIIKHRNASKNHSQLTAQSLKRGSEISYGKKTTISYTNEWDAADGRSKVGTPINRRQSSTSNAYSACNLDVDSNNNPEHTVQDYVLAFFASNYIDFDIPQRIPKNWPHQFESLLVRLLRKELHKDKKPYKKSINESKRVPKASKTNPNLHKKCCDICRRLNHTEPLQLYMIEMKKRQAREELKLYYRYKLATSFGLPLATQSSSPLTQSSSPLKLSTRKPRSKTSSVQLTSSRLETQSMRQLLVECFEMLCDCQMILDNKMKQQQCNERCL
ncbi:inner centromere protein A-like [Drosophila grimshawi]|uniref:inner centromere protein A-like n=1 Tax=Drosophila grimshawi TaxID=7222 RepID=UPI0013EF3288|nr:inner centromere protein A-like [Drosophila grimshawi]